MKRVLLGTAACFSLLFQGAAAQAQDAVSDVAPVPAAAVENPEEPSGPALWMLADEDTTIYLFGTVHALPREVKWRVGPVEQALEYSSTLVTEIPGDAITDPSSQQMIAAKAMLSGDKTMRDLLDADQRVSYETAMSKLGLPVDAFDRFEPWFAGMTLAMLPLLKAGYDMDSGVEKVIEKDLSPQVTRDALETIGFQIDMFDQLPMQSQISFLMSSAENIESVSPMMDKMVAEWMEGDADGLAALLNEGLTDPVLTNILLYNRNAKWAEWIDNRMDKPGAVFVAVGAGHLAGEKSVQYYLTQRGFRVERVQ
ncbi:TraB/GumN family protein [Qipengyuania sp. RANM35]|uniref:TraB/GumN family protein n=1 Tax=Qipengyuania sp. RANM35 TaxID=3068635 RepID=UPI0034DAC2DD